VLQRVGVPIAPADAVPEVRAAAALVTRLPGGAGAVREAVERLLDREHRLEAAVSAFVAREEGFSIGAEERGTR
jgi:3-deoxy-D-manno-octulosonate 8-phosphate phosphatase (KDO 8-P phosphatase)